MVTHGFGYEEEVGRGQGRMVVVGGGGVCLCTRHMGLWLPLYGVRCTGKVLLQPVIDKLCVQNLIDTAFPFIYTLFIIFLLLK